MTKYQMLVNVIDRLRGEAAPTKRATTYLPPASDLEAVNQARSRAFIHLYLKVSFGLLDFADREHFITDGSYDGGIDGYYISRSTRLIYLIQSKFRASEKNFIGKDIALEELLAMDIDRILDGHEHDEPGNPYNGKILQLQRELGQLDHIARYTYRIIILANVKETLSPSHLSKLVGGYSCEVINYERCYDLLVFPVLSGTYFNATDLVIHLDLSNKNAGSKISYTVDTQYGECDITVLFVPTIEIARTFHRYKNSMLKFNPRSYLELEGGKVNAAIRDTIVLGGKNEFALYNNGITMLSDETNLNERIGQRNKAQLNVMNPQIINGGQTAYTLSRLYEETEEDKREAIFAGKEVLLKVITLNAGSQATAAAKVSLIDSISIATNRQTAVIAADRYSNEPYNLELQKLLFDNYGLLYERKRGEFQDGIYQQYIERDLVLERNLFFRVYLCANGHIRRAVERKAFERSLALKESVPTRNELDRFYFAYLCLPFLAGTAPLALRGNRSLAGKLYALASWYRPSAVADFPAAVVKAREEFDLRWVGFIEQIEQNQSQAGPFLTKKRDKNTGEDKVSFNFFGWLLSDDFLQSVDGYVAVDAQGQTQGSGG